MYRWHGSRAHELDTRERLYDELVRRYEEEYDDAWSPSKSYSQSAHLPSERASTSPPRARRGPGPHQTF